MDKLCRRWGLPAFRADPRGFQADFLVDTIYCVSGSTAEEMSSGAQFLLLARSWIVDIWLYMLGIAPAPSYDRPYLIDI